MWTMQERVLKLNYKKMKLYKARASISQNGQSVILQCNEIKVVDMQNECIKTKDFHVINNSTATNLFSMDMLDIDYKIGDFLSVYYSTNIKKCIKWLDKAHTRLNAMRCGT